MTAEILTVTPDLHFGCDEPFQVEDQFNKARGTWFFRSRMSGEVEGPFHSRAKAKFFQDFETYKLGTP